jgi:hypothetical protein
MTNFIPLREFMRLVERRKRNEKRESTCVEHKEVDNREPVLRPDQELFADRRKQQRRLVTCPECDAVVDADYVDPHSGLCPLCHELRRWKYRSI